MSIELKDVSKRHGRNLVVDRVSLEVAEKELFVLLGTSGSGKSTTLRLIAGLIAPDAGRILLRGRDVTDLPPQARGTGFVFQDYSLFRYMSVGENVEFGLRLRGEKARERAERRDELLELVGLAGHARKLPDQLSGGQQQRVALARALAYHPDVLLLDEPFGALDVKTRAQLRRTLKDLQHALGVTTVLVTHDQDEAFELADRIAVLDRGQLLEVSEPERLYRSPRTPFAATFVGAGTVLVGPIREGHVRLGGAAIPMPAGADHAEGETAHVLIRPEHVVLGDAPGSMTLGTGTILEETFGGPTRSLRLALPRPAGVRQQSPLPPFGEERLVVDVLVSGTAPRAAGDVAVGFTAWHVLEPPPPSLLALGAPKGDALAMAATLARGLRGRVTVLGVAPDADAAVEERTRLQEHLAAGKLDQAEVRVRVGDLARQLQHEQHEGHHAMIVASPEEPEPVAQAGPERRRVPRLHRLGPVIEALLDDPIAPLLVVPQARPEVRRLLACTAVGEPGEHAVRLAGWLARRLGAKVTLLHVLQGAAPAGARAQQHLERARRTLAAMDVEAVVKLRSAPVAAAGILAESLEHDMVLIGHHGPQRASLLARDNVTVQVLSGADRPVLVVTGNGRR